MRRFSAAKLTIVFVLGVLSPVYGQTADTESLPFAAGVTVFVDPDQDMEAHLTSVQAVLDLGITWYHHRLAWEQVEPREGEFDWSSLDRVIPMVAEAGLRLLVTVSDTPDWARTDVTASDEAFDRDGPPDDVVTLVRLLVALFERYPASIHALEIWSGQNLAANWSGFGGVDPAEYVDLVDKVAQVMRADHPDVMLVSGALAPASDFVAGLDTLVMDDYIYMQAMLEAGLLDHVDCVGASHPGFNVPPDALWNGIPFDPDAQFRGPFDNPHHSWSFRSTLEGYATFIAEDGESTPLCVTGFGWGTAPNVRSAPDGFEFAADNTPDEQASFTVQALDLMRDWEFVAWAIVSNLNAAVYAPELEESWQRVYSLLDSRGNPRPVFDALRQWSAAS